MENYTLIVTEKPDAAARIASALDEEGKPKRLLENGVPYYVAERGGEIVVVPALGHLYTVAAEKKGQDYPICDYKWVPLYVADRKAKRTRTWLGAIAKLAKNAGAFVDACDFDIEGSIIGYSILKFACDGADKTARRMKYSTLTKEELQASYEETLPHLNFCLIDAGLARHEIDWLYGINLSRALTTAAKKASGQYATLSTGRVQGPILNFLAQRETSIRSFVPTPYWIVKAKIRVGDAVLDVDYEKAAIEKKEDADAVVKACRKQRGKIEKVTTNQFQQPPPPPFDLSSLQREAYRLFKSTPMRTSSIAQRLYLNALISYPRTSSQKLPPTIGYKTILKQLSRNRVFTRHATELLAKPDLKPHEGKGFDPAHPAIYPTGKLPERAPNSAERNVWGLVVKRFMAAFGEPAAQKTSDAVINVNGYKFNFNAKEILEEGWMRFYKPYVHTENPFLPQMAEGAEVNVEKIAAKEEFSKPLPRYNPASLLRKMQAEEIGTKATRAGIIQTLYDRKYVCDDKMVVTDLGFEVVDVLGKYCPTVVSSKFTRKLEAEMEKIQKGEETKQAVVAEAIELLKPVAAELKENEAAIGIQLTQAIRKAKLEERTLGVCPTCKDGKLVIIYSKKTCKRFVGCTGYFEGKCKIAFPIPQRGVVKPQGVCKSCGWPTARILTRRMRPWTLCFNPHCPSKKKKQSELPQSRPSSSSVS